MVAFYGIDPARQILNGATGLKHARDSKGKEGEQRSGYVMIHRSRCKRPNRLPDHRLSRRIHILVILLVGSRESAIFKIDLSILPDLSGFICVALSLLEFQVGDPFFTVSILIAHGIVLAIGINDA